MILIFFFFFLLAAVWVVLANCLAGRGDRAFELFELVNPITHAADKETVEIYKTEVILSLSLSLSLSLCIIITTLPIAICIVW